MSYGIKQGADTEGLSIASLPPGIYKEMVLKTVKAEKTTKNDGTQGKNIITFLFDGPQGAHQHTEFEVSDTDPKADSKKANLSKRVSHIMTKFIPKTAIESVMHENFEGYAAWVAATLNPSVTANKKVEIKIIGSVYNGEARSNFPGYVPFVANPAQSEYKPLSFSANEIKSNDEYFNHVSGSPDTESSPSTDGGKADFIF